MLRRPVALIALGLLLAGCAGRTAHPVATQQSFDQDMGCEQLASEFDSNKKSINRLNEELEGLDGRNAAVIVVGVLLAGPGMLMALDNGKAAETEIVAFKTRNRHLGELSVAKDCGNEELAAAATAPFTAAPAKGGEDGQSALATQPGSTGSAGTTTSTLTPEEQARQAADLAAAQGAFEAWLSSNRPVLERELMAYLRKTDLHGASNGAQQIAALSSTRVKAQTETGYVVTISYTLRRISGWGETYSHTDSFSLEIVNDALTGIELAAAAKVAATPTASAAAGAEPAAPPDLGAAQASFEAWLAENQEAFKTELTRYGRTREIDGLNSSAGMRHVSTLTNIKVLEQRGEAYVVEMNYDTEGAQAYTAQATRGVVKVLVTLADGRLVGIDPA